MNKYQEYEDAKEILKHLPLTPEQYDYIHSWQEGT